VTLGGGGTDLPSYYEEREGFLIAAAINKYVFVTINRPFKEGIFLKYSQYEQVQRVADIAHPIIREALAMLDLKTPQIEITSLADVPAGTGLGSSGSFTTALLKGLHAYRREHIHQEELARLACHIEMDLLKEHVGKQDQYIAAYGGLTCFTFRKDGTVEAQPLSIPVEAGFELEDNLLLFFTGYTHSASNILKDQDTRSQKGDDDMLKNLDFVKELGYRSKEALEAGDCVKFGEIMHEHWEHKKRRSGGMSNPRIDELYELGMKNGAVGGKLVGAGGGGFLMFYAVDRDKLRRAMKGAGLEELRFGFDYEGTRVLPS
jgi:Predicted kinase related to galactokinase and mevalonate kinase